jgi:transposase
MPRLRTTMRQIREVLRLRFEKKLSERQMAQAVGVGRTTLQGYLRKAVQAQLSWPLPPELNDEQLEKLLYPPLPLANEKVDTKSLPDFLYLHQELKKKGVTIQLLWEEYQQANSQGYQYTQFRVRYRQWEKTLEPVMRQTHKAGEKLFVDYAGMTMGVVDRQTGEVREAQIFVGVLGASNYTYVEATWTQALPNWIGSHVRMFSFIGAVPELLIPDNLKSGVTTAHRYEPFLNRTYQEMAEHYGVAILPARPIKPRDKAKVEVGVQGVERRILAPLRNRTFFSLHELNEAIWELLQTYNQRPFQKLSSNRQTLFETLEKPLLKPLPSQSYEYAEWKKVRVNIDYHVEVEKHYYSVPYQLIRQQLDARLTASVVEILHQGKRVASHPRSFIEHKHTTVLEHMPQGHREYAEWTPVRLVQWAGESGESTRAVVEKILASHRHPEQGYRSCLGIMRLGKKYGKDRLEAACRRVLNIPSPRYQHIESILKLGLDQKPLESEQPVLPAFTHEFVRGAEYYQTQN